MITHSNAAIAVDVLRSHLDQLNGKIATLTEERDAVAKVLESLLSHDGSTSAPPRTDWGNRSHSAGAGPNSTPQETATDLNDLVVDFNGVSNLRERLIRIAHVKEGVLLNITKVARFLIDAGGVPSHCPEPSYQRARRP